MAVEQVLVVVAVLDYVGFLDQRLHYLALQGVVDLLSEILAPWKGDQDSCHFEIVHGCIVWCC